MKTVDKPTFNAKDTFSICISHIRDIDLKERLVACENLVIQAESEFNSKIATGEIYTISKERYVNGNVSAEELKKVYTQSMVKTGSPGRAVYDKLLSAPKHGICPLCSHRLVETLDHYLPKSEFPRLATTPINLIPSCSTCNKAKLTKSPCRPEEATLHPYYDNIENGVWLSATVNHTIPPTVSYYVAPPPEWPNLLKERVKYHFQSFSLNKLYSTQAAVLLGNLSKRLESIHNKLGIEGVRRYLKDEAESRFNYDKNSWETAFYKTLSIDDWFCDEGYRM